MKYRGFFTAVLWVAIIGFSLFFFLSVLPPALESGDLLGAFAAGFVNPFAAGYATDVILCWVVLAAWVFYEAKVKGVRHGWLCCVLGIMPGVVVGLALYLLIRQYQLVEKPRGDNENIR